MSDRTLAATLRRIAAHHEQLARELLEHAAQIEREPESQPEQDPLLDRNAAARLLDVSLAGFDRLRRMPHFPELRVGASPRFRRSALIEWLERASAAPPGLRVVK